MDPKKRNFITQLFSWAFAAPLALLAIRAAFARQNPTSKLPGGGTPVYDGHNDPFGDSAPKPDPKQVLKQNKEQIHDDVEKLYTLATELKDEVEKTDSANVLSLTMVNKAEQVEKLAKQIKNLSRG